VNALTKPGLDMLCLSSAQLVNGVVQGSGIGPLMFLIFINELAEVLDRAGKGSVIC